jgi:hypothetical protein
MGDPIFIMKNQDFNNHMVYSSMYLSVESCTSHDRAVMKQLSWSGGRAVSHSIDCG